MDEDEIFGLVVVPALAFEEVEVVGVDPEPVHHAGELEDRERQPHERGEPDQEARVTLGQVGRVAQDGADRECDRE